MTRTGASHAVGRPGASRRAAVRGRRGAAAVALTAALAGGLAASPAVAAGDDGLWYVRDTGVAEAQATADGSGITVAVIDSPLNPDVAELAGADVELRAEAFCDADGDGVEDPAASTDGAAEHGTTVAALIAGDGGAGAGVQGVAPGARVLYYAWHSGDASACNATGVAGVAAAIDQAVADGAQIINLSVGGEIPDAAEIEAVGRAIRAGVVVVASGGNTAGPAREWPGLANGVVTVTSVDAQQELHEGYEIYGPGIDVAAPGVALRTFAADGGWDTHDLGSGTSLATAWTSGGLALAWSAHPEATGNQMIQSLLRNTITGEGELRRLDDYWGYGIASVRRMVEADPTTYPDTNPLVVDHPDARPPASDLTAGPTAEPTPEQTDPPTSPPADGPAVADDAEESTSMALPLALGLGALVVVGVVVTLVLARRRTDGSTVPTDRHEQER